MCQPRIDRMRDPEAPHSRIHSARVAAHDRETAVRENRASNAGALTPGKLDCHGCVTDQLSRALPSQRTHKGRPIADIEVDSAQCLRSIRQRGYIGKVENGMLPERRRDIRRQERGANAGPNMP